MINFHLQFPIPEFNKKINYQQKIICIGSCFSENIGSLLTQHKLDTLTNTHGIQYNPWSITNALNKSLLNQPAKENELFYENDLWHSWEHPGKFSNSKKQECLRQINAQINKGYNYLHTADWLVITLGSSFVYKHITNDYFVANCHKVPQKHFSKHLLSTQETIALFENFINQLKEKNKSLKIIFTISPVRYIRDGAVENNLSKARLIDAVHTLVDKFDNCFYFPVYELIIDDLRDYRFFEKDLVHPNQQAVEYVFEKFVESTFDNESKKIIKKIKEIIRAKNHRVADINSDSNQVFKKLFLDKCITLKNEYPYLDFKNEMDYFRN